MTKKHDFHLRYLTVFSILTVTLALSLILFGCSNSGGADTAGQTDGQADEQTTYAEDTMTNETVSQTEHETEAETKEPVYMRTRVSDDPGEDPFNVTEGAAPDPFITYDTGTGYYYALCTKNSYLMIQRSRTVANIFKEGEALTVYRTGNEVSDSIWAPEMYLIDGKWYIYTSATVPDTDGLKHLFVLESETADPFDGFHFKAFLNNRLFAIDPTLYQDPETGKLYLCFSEVYNGLQWLSIAELSDPWTFGSKVGTRQGRIANPKEFDWESMGGVPLNEGPFFVSSGDRLFIIYSANGCYNDSYRLGCLEFTGTDMLSNKSWTKSSEWLFAMTDEIYAPGHASFFHSPDGTELWIAYHCYDSPNTGDRRRMRVCQVQKVGFDESGYPVLGEPLPKDTMIAVPSGEANLPQ